MRALAASPEAIAEEYIAVFESFVVLLYNKTSNDERQELLPKKSRMLENIPPTRAAIVNHIKRAVFQGGYIWVQTLLKEPVLLHSHYTNIITLLAWSKYAMTVV